MSPLNYGYDQNYIKNEEKRRWAPPWIKLKFYINQYLMKLPNNE